jgi:hypothetical protein
LFSAFVFFTFTSFSSSIFAVIYLLYISFLFLYFIIFFINYPPYNTKMPTTLITNLYILMKPTLKIKKKASPFNYLQKFLNYFLYPALSSENYILPPKHQVLLSYQKNWRS